MSKKSSTIFVFSFLLFICIVLLFLSTVSFFQPIQGFINFFTTPVQASFSHIFYEADDMTSLKKLRAENTQLRKKLVDQKKLEAENNALRDQFQTNKPSNTRLLPAQVIGSPGFLPGVAQPEMLIIDKGAWDGIQKGEAVVVKDNLIGSISRVSPAISVVTLLSHSDMSFTAKTVETNATGIIKNSDASSLLLENVLLSAVLKRGDMVVTKGDILENGKGFPPDLIVGTIIDIEKKPSALFQTARLKSLVDIPSVTTVFIVHTYK